MPGKYLNPLIVAVILNLSTFLKILFHKKSMHTSAKFFYLFARNSADYFEFLSKDPSLSLHSKNHMHLLADIETIIHQTLVSKLILKYYVSIFINLWLRKKKSCKVPTKYEKNCTLKILDLAISFTI